MKIIIIQVVVEVAVHIIMVQDLVMVLVATEVTEQEVVVDLKEMEAHEEMAEVVQVIQVQYQDKLFFMVAVVVDMMV